MRWFHPFRSPRKPARVTAPRTLLQVESLESRVVPYSVSGNMWPHPGLISISFMPDGTNLGNVSSNLFATFNAKFGSPAAWQNVILKAAQTWAQQTNINFTLIPDSGAPSGSGSYQQGDPTMGDIRIGGYNFGSSALAMTFQPPSVNNYSIAGDMAFNTGQTFNMNSQNYDLFTVALHEFGHALGLDHSGSLTAVMYASYNGVKQNVPNDDVAGIRNIYSNNNPRSSDAFGSTNSSFTAAANLTASIDSGNLTALVPNLDITTAGEKDYFTVTAPAGTGNTVTINVQSQGLSLLAPTLTIYAANQTTVLGSVSGYGHYGTTLTVNLTSKIAAGQVFYIKVAGADTTALGTGAYALTMSFAGNPLPAVPVPNTRVANGTPLSGGGGLANNSNAVGDLVSPVGTLLNKLGLLSVADNGTSDSFDVAAGVGQPSGIGPALAAFSVTTPPLALVSIQAPVRGWTSGPPIWENLLTQGLSVPASERVAIGSHAIPTTAPIGRSTLVPVGVSSELFGDAEAEGSGIGGAGAAEQLPAGSTDRVAPPTAAAPESETWGHFLDEACFTDGEWLATSTEAIPATLGLTEPAIDVASGVALGLVLGAYGLQESMKKSLAPSLASSNQCGKYLPGK